MTLNEFKFFSRPLASQRWKNIVNKFVAWPFSHHAIPNERGRNNYNQKKLVTFCPPFFFRLPLKKNIVLVLKAKRLTFNLVLSWLEF